MLMKQRESSNKKHDRSVMVAVIGASATIIVAVITGVFGLLQRQPNVTSTTPGILLSPSPSAAIVSQMSSPTGHSSTLIPTNTARFPISATPTLPTGPYLFREDFKTTELKWQFSGKNYALVNNVLTIQDGFIASQFLGANSWIDYAVRLGGYFIGDRFTVFMRAQDADNAMAFECRTFARDSFACSWYKILNGQKIEITATTTYRKDDKVFPLRLEAKDNIYRMIFSEGTEDEKINSYADLDKTFSNGAFAFSTSDNSYYNATYIEVMTMP
jgi:hypothetical protein